MPAVRRLAVAVGVVLAVAGVLWRAPLGTRTSPPAAAAPAVGRSESDGSGTVAAVRAVWPLPASLQGTSPDGGVETDGFGHLRPSRELRQLFDYYLSASGEEPRRRINARIVAALREQLPSPAADEAVAVLRRYLVYRRAVRRVPPDLATVHAVRVRILGRDVAEAFFAVDEAAASFLLARRAVATDPDLAPAERDARLAALEARLPEQVRALRAEAATPLQLMREEEALRASGGSDADIRALRERMVGADAADRLAALDQDRAAWQTRVDQYRADRRAIEENRSLDAASRAAALDALRASRFSEPEQLRVAALDRIAGLDPR
jgi:lipase chaperone LimK